MNITGAAQVAETTAHEALRTIEDYPMNRERGWQPAPRANLRPRSSLPHWRSATLYLQQDATSAQLRLPVQQFLIARCLLMYGSQCGAPITLLSITVPNPGIHPVAGPSSMPEILPVTDSANLVRHHVAIRMSVRSNVAIRLASEGN
jgi:hypothetical protein